MFQGFAVVQGKVWKEPGTPRWEFKCKQYGTKTLNTRSLEPRKLEDEKGKIVINRQRNTIVKAKKDYGFKYLLSYKTVNKNSEEKEYIRILKCLTYTYVFYLNLFLFKVYEKNIVEY